MKIQFKAEPHAGVVVFTPNGTIRRASAGVTIPATVTGAHVGAREQDKRLAMIAVREMQGRLGLRPGQMIDAYDPPPGVTVEEAGRLFHVTIDTGE